MFLMMLFMLILLLMMFIMSILMMMVVIFLFMIICSCTVMHLSSFCLEFDATSLLSNCPVIFKHSMVTASGKPSQTSSQLRPGQVLLPPGSHSPSCRSVGSTKNVSTSSFLSCISCNNGPEPCERWVLRLHTLCSSWCRS